MEIHDILSEREEDGMDVDGVIENSSMAGMFHNFGFHTAHL